METEEQTNEIPSAPSDTGSADNGSTGGSGGPNVLVIVLIIALVVALVAIAALAIAVLSGGSSGSEGEATLPPPGTTVEPTEESGLIPTRQPPIVFPTPESQDPTATVTAPDGANVRTGPGTEYTIIGTAPQGSTGEVVGISEDGQWYAIQVPGAPNTIGWVLGELVSVENVDNVPVIPAPTPPATATPSPTPGPDIVFTASRTKLTAGETSILTWSVENVQAVYLYPVGANWPNYPVTGQGTKEVQPYITTTYQLRVIKIDGNTEFSNIEIEVNGGITDGIWRLKAYESPSGGLVSVISGSDVNARFDPSGKVGGSGGCNTYSGGYQAYDETLRIGSLNATQTLCDEGLMQQEAAFFSAMERAASMSIIGSELSVRDSSGRTILSFTRS